MLTNFLYFLEIALFTPEEKIIEQGEYGKDMFFIQTGDCILNLMDHNRQEYMPPRLLVPGEHFGEIGALYNCQRTCTIIGRFYNTLAQLTYSKFRAFINAYPEY